MCYTSNVDMRYRKIFKKDECINVRLPKADKDRVETEARLCRDNPSNTAWQLIAESLDRREAQRREKGAHLNA